MDNYFTISYSGSTPSSGCSLTVDATNLLDSDAQAVAEGLLPVAERILEGQGTVTILNVNRYARSETVIYIPS